MMQLLTAALAMGMLGSFHCVGMCGPLALSLPLSRDTLWAKFSGALLYNTGRIVTYAAFGALFGVIGKTMALFGFQQWLSVILGVIIVIFILLPKRFTAFANNNMALSFLQKLRSGLGGLFAKRSYSSLFLIGLLNGLLPCALVYMAAAGAIATGDVGSSILFMIFFGMGTLPVMWSIAFFGNYISVSIRQKIRRIYPYMMMGVACLLILRGMGLGIPYISPKADTGKIIMQHCYVMPEKLNK